MLRKVPHTYVIVFAIIVLAAILTWFIPPGKYIQETQIINGKETQGVTFYYLEDLPADQKVDFNPEIQSWQVFAALFKGFVKQSNIIIFILMIGGAFWIMNQTKAIDVGIYSFLKFTRKLENTSFMRKLGVDNIVFVLIMLLFSIFGAVFGMSEETIAFVIILIPLAISMGYDSLTGVC